MFGYIRIAKPELKIKDYETYKAVYCSLCRELGKSYGLLSRFTLSYDFTFLALLNISLSDSCPAYEKKHCVFNPLKKCNFCKNTDLIEMPTAAAIIMIYYKLKDNLLDKKGIKKLKYYFALPYFSFGFKKAKKRYPQIEKIVGEYISEQNELESNNCDSMDMAANPTANALSKIFMMCSQDEIEKRVLERLGYCIGRYIYLLDAACDLEDDKKSGAYNVLKCLPFEENKDIIKDRIVPQLYFSINEAAKSFELLNIKKYKDILGNIIYLGLEETFKKELKI